MGDEVWTTRDGRIIAVADMEEAYCRDVLRMLLRKRRLRMDMRRGLNEALDGLAGAQSGKHPAMAGWVPCVNSAHCADCGQTCCLAEMTF